MYDLYDLYDHGSCCRVGVAYSLHDLAREKMENARTVHAACKVEYRSICRSVELTADALFQSFIKILPDEKNYY